jgi:hypothetical protein
MRGRLQSAQNFTLLACRELLAVDELLLEVVRKHVADLDVSFEGTIGQTSSTL